MACLPMKGAGLETTIFEVFAMNEVIGRIFKLKTHVNARDANLYSRLATYGDAPSLRVNTSPRALVAVSLALLGVLGGLSACAALATQPSDANPSCNREMRRIAVWPKGSPKIAQSPRFEQREVTVCDGKVVSQSPRNALSHTDGQR
jgi:hypothetical protein